MIDAHCWIEYNDKVVDYSDNELSKASAYGTKHIVRKEFPLELQLKLLPIVLKIYNDTQRELKESNEFFGVSLKLPDEVGMCVIKAIDFKKKYPKAKIKIGSLGFVQSNGDIFYEFG